MECYGSDTFDGYTAVQFITADAAARLERVVSATCKHTGLILWFAFSSLCNARAENQFTFDPPPDVLDQEADSVSDMTGWFHILRWDKRGQLIRQGGNDRCIASLAYILNQVSITSAGEYNGASSALSLLPTAGALITAPTRELWVLLQLVPVAGILNIFLSLGGSITPKDAGDYDLNRPFNYGGMIAKREMVDSYEEMVQEKALLEDVDRSNKEKTRASRFAQQVKRRVTDHSGKGSSAAVWAGLTLQLLLLISMLTAMWYAQLGSIIPWWCRVWGWMYFWYFLVVVVSVFDNYFATPFRNTWTLRVSKLPRNLRGISECPSVIEDAGDPCMALDRIERSGGVNSKIWLTVDDAPNDVPKQCFYVLISSQSGVSHWSALIRSMSRGASVTVYAFGTTLFASCQLMCISAALMVLSVVLAAGVLGRIVSMWIVSQLQMGDRKDESPIMHAIVKDRKEASDYVQEIVTIEGIMVEIQGHVLTQGHCIHRGTHGWNRLESYIGLLKGPYDIVGKAIDRPTAPQRRSSGLSRLRSWMTSSGLTKGSNV